MFITCQTQRRRNNLFDSSISSLWLKHQGESLLLPESRREAVHAPLVGLLSAKSWAIRWCQKRKTSPLLQRLWPWVNWRESAKKIWACSFLALQLSQWHQQDWNGLRGRKRGEKDSSEGSARVPLLSTVKFSSVGQVLLLFPVKLAACSLHFKLWKPIKPWLTDTSNPLTGCLWSCASERMLFSLCLFLIWGSHLTPASLHSAVGGQAPAMLDQCAWVGSVS